MLSRISWLWKGAAGSAILAAVAVGTLEDLRSIVLDRAFGAVFPQGDADAQCVDDHFAAVPRPDPAAFHLLLTQPLGDAEGRNLRIIDRTLRRLYGEDAAAPVQVEMLACPPILPEGGLASENARIALDRARDLRERSGADVVIWGDVIADGALIEIRMAGAGDAAAQAGDFASDAIVMESRFAESLGSMVAARALTLAQGAGVPVPDRDARMEEALAVIAPVEAAIPPGMAGRSRAELHVAAAIARQVLGLSRSDPALLTAAAGSFAAAAAQIDAGADPLRAAMLRGQEGVALTWAAEIASDPALLDRAIAALDAAAAQMPGDAPAALAEVLADRATARAAQVPFLADPAPALARVRADLEQAVALLPATAPLADRAALLRRLPALDVETGVAGGDLALLDRGIAGYRAALGDLTAAAAPPAVLADVNFALALALFNRVSFGDIDALPSARAALEAALAGRPLAEGPMIHAITQEVLARVLQAEAGILGTPGAADAARGHAQAARDAYAEAGAAENVAGAEALLAELAAP